ncbi:TetR/AcrR family transcriptional regulator [Timonella senegalensis]|uniref:TetR/AcrR family transcriptional regulator n=1 Tax=Timonella senegalensis TaxID=1465825 RepID=UPI0028B03E89|nr:TetR/AcrR family transcriptional regulator [Timonella senegalensis]
MRSSGRPRSTQTTENAIEEALKILREEGVGSLSMERVAANIGVSKPSLYRRWKDRGELIMDALQRVVEIGDCPDTGNLAEDLYLYGRQSLENESRATSGADSNSLMRTVLSPEIAPLYFERIGQHRRKNGLLIVQRAVARGELPVDVNASLLLDMLSGTVFFHAYMQRLALQDSELRQIVRTICATPPVLTDQD